MLVSHVTIGCRNPGLRSGSESLLSQLCMVSRPLLSHQAWWGSSRSTPGGDESSKGYVWAININMVRVSEVRAEQLRSCFIINEGGFI